VQEFAGKSNATKVGAHGSVVQFTAARKPRNNGAKHRPAGADRCDYVADPVNEVQEAAFRLCAGLSLNRRIELWSRSLGAGVESLP
jgi:hypothetical protein